VNPCWNHHRNTIDFGDGVVASLGSADFDDLRRLIVWAVGRMPPALVDRLPRLALRRELEVREIADEIATEGFPWTANEIRAKWGPLCS
jgi:hypothetical protein